MSAPWRSSSTSAAGPDLGMDPTRTLDETAAALEARIAHAGDELRGALAASELAKAAAAGTLRFVVLRIDFVDTLSDFGEYRIDLAMSDGARVYRATLQPGRRLCLRALPEVVTELGWRDRAGLEDLVRRIYPAAALDLGARLERALPDECRGELLDGSMAFMLVDALPRESGAYRLEVRLRCSGFTLGDVGMELGEFAIVMD